MSNNERGLRMTRELILVDKSVHRWYTDWADDVVDEAYAIARKAQTAGPMEKPLFVSGCPFCVMDESLHANFSPDDYCDEGYLDIDGTRYYFMGWRHEMVAA